MGQAKLRALGDGPLALLAQAGDSRAADELVRRYERLAYKIASRFATPLSSHDDMRQEALVGLYMAVRYFKTDAGQSFFTFAYTCISRWIYTIIKRDTTKGRYRADAVPLSLDAPLDGDDDLTLIGMVADEWASQPGDHERLDVFRALFAFIAIELSDLERESIVGIACGESYDEILDRLADTDLTKKSIDNAVQRARRRCAPFLADLRDAA